MAVAGGPPLGSEPPPSDPCGRSSLIGPVGGGKGGGGGSGAAECDIALPLQNGINQTDKPPRVDGPNNAKTNGVVENLDGGTDTGNDPVRLVSGSVVLSETDIVIPCPLIDLVFMREYDSNLRGGETLGYRWVHSYDWTLLKYREVDGELGDWMVLRAIADPNLGPYKGGYHCFKKQTNGLYGVSQRSPYVLTEVQDGHEVKIPGGVVYSFDSAGTLIGIAHPAGQSVDLTYTSGKLSKVEHSNGKALDFAYNAASQISEITTPSTNLSVSYTYDVGTNAPTVSTTRPLLLKTLRKTPRGEFALTYGYGQPGEETP
jgi:YD repeat-containing protein